MLFLSMISNSISGIPSSAGLSPGTTKNVQLTCLSLCLIFSLYMPSFSMFDRLYVFNPTVLFVWHVTQVLWALESQV